VKKALLALMLLSFVCLASTIKTAKEYKEEMIQAGVYSDLINEAIKSGDVCDHAGHNWEYPSIIVVTIDTSTNVSPEVFTRKCKLCGKKQTQTIEDWK
jgi:hypothetical protein